MEKLVRHPPPKAFYCQQRLLDNLAVLQRLDAELALRLTWPVDDSAVFFTEQGEMRYLAHRVANSLAVPGDLPEFGSPSLLLLGLGSGDILDHALSHASSACITCWERDPWLLRLDLMRRDRRQELSSGRLRYCLGQDLLERRDWEGSVLRHPVLSAHYTLELDSFAGPKRAKRALLCVGKLFYEQIARALRNQGYELWSLDLERQATEELQRTVERFQPDLILSINYTHGLAEFCAKLGCKLLVWEVDPSLSEVAPCSCSTREAWIWTYRKANVEGYRAAGFENVAYLALAADPEIRAPTDLDDAQRERYGAPLAFVGSSMLTEALEFKRRFSTEYALWHGGADAEQQADALFKELLASQRQAASSYTLPALLDQRAAGFRAHCMAQSAHADPATLVAELCGAEKRLSYVAHLMRHGILVWGDRGWEQLVASGLDYRGPANHGSELTLIYNATLINLDINRIYQPDIITMRVFDVLSAGGFVLAEYSEALAEAFVIGAELDCYRDLKELHTKVEHYLANPEAARAIAQRGRERVLKEHTIAARLCLMLEQAGL